MQNKIESIEIHRFVSFLNESVSSLLDYDSDNILFVGHLFVCSFGIGVCVCVFCVAIQLQLFFLNSSIQF